MGRIRTAYRPEVDGLRAFAVLPVIMFHAGFDLFSGGFVGVDVFFVISGFLITNLLLQDMEAGRFSIGNFYERRARRILPALIFVALACVPFSWAWMPRGDFAEFSKSLISVSLFVSNIQFWMEAGYFTSENKPLLHTWSLAVEEQFYILFPLILFLLMRGGRRVTYVALILGVLVSFGFSQWASRHMPSVNFYLLPTRAWELGVGALCAFWTARPHGRSGEVLAAAGFTAVIASVFWIDGDMPFPSAIALPPVVGTALVLLFATGGTAVARLLALKPIVFVGLISYSAYLIHHPIFAFARRLGLHPENTTAFAGLTVVSLLLAALSWRFVEHPFRDRAWLSRRAVFSLALIGSGILAGAGVLGLLMANQQHALYRGLLSPQSRVNADMIAQSGIGRFDDGVCRFWNVALDDGFDQRFRACAGEYGPALLVFGDSHGRNVFNAIARHTDRAFVVGVVQGGCRPHDIKPTCYFDRFERFVDTHGADIDMIVFHQSGSYFIADDRGRVDSSRAFRDGVETSFDTENIDRVIAYLDRLGETADVVWLGPFAEYRDRRNVHRLRSQTFNPNSVPLFDQLESVISDRIRQVGSGSFRYVALHPHLGHLYGRIVVDDCLIVRDMDHWSHCGEDLVGEIIKSKKLLE